MSSRNPYLGAEERKTAAALHRSLKLAEELVHRGETRSEQLLGEIRKALENQPGVQLDYVAIVEPSALQAVERVFTGCVALVAARVGPARLIDNLIFGPPGENAERLIQAAMTSRHITSPEARIPGLEIDLLKKKIETCRECAAFTAIRLPPSEFLVKYLRRDYPDLGKVGVAIIARDSPLKAENYLYSRASSGSRFTATLFELIGVSSYEEFCARFVLTDALRCHCTGPRAPERALTACSRFMMEELRLLPNLHTILVLGEDAYAQLQRNVLGRRTDETMSFHERLGTQGWSEERVLLRTLGGKDLRVIYAHHPTLGYRRSPSLAQILK